MKMYALAIALRLFTRRIVTFESLIIRILQIFQEACSAFCDSNGTVTANGLTQFLLTVQGERNILEKQVARHMREYLQDNQRNVQEPYFTVNEVATGVDLALPFRSTLETFGYLTCCSSFFRPHLVYGFFIFTAKRHLGSEV